MRLIGKADAAADCSRVPAQENADGILSLLDQLVEADDLSLGLFHQQLSLQNICLGEFSALEIDGVQLQHVLIGDQGLLGVLELGIELAHPEIRACDIRDQTCAHHVLSKLSSHQVG